MTTYPILLCMIGHSTQGFFSGVSWSLLVLLTNRILFNHPPVIMCCYKSLGPWNLFHECFVGYKVQKLRPSKISHYTVTTPKCNFLGSLPKVQRGNLLVWTFLHLTRVLANPLTAPHKRIPENLSVSMLLHKYLCKWLVIIFLLWLML